MNPSVNKKIVHYSLFIVYCSLFICSCRPNHPSASESFRDGRVEVIPQPRQTKLCEGVFDVGKDVNIICQKELNDVVSLFNKRLSDVMGLTFPVETKGGSNGNITLKVAPAIAEKEGKKSSELQEGYALVINPSCIRIEASAVEGVFYGLQTLQQMILNSKDGKIPCCSIADSPRFAWRGVMLDVSRTFMPVNLLKRYIDLFAEYKLNVLHLHLTDDQGWRIEIKQYPRLTLVGSKFAPEFNCMGGYYTQDEIRELIRYANLRNITIVPEIDMPGHMCAAIAVYPELSCTGEIPLIHPHLEGPGIHEEVFCAGKESTYQFIFNVLDEIMSLFPTTYIHIGGDEVPKAYWKACPDCQKMIADNQLKDEEELQSYFVSRLGTYLREKGRTLVGWDEIIDGGKLTGNEVIMYWRTRNQTEVEKAIKSGFRVVCTPRSHCYFDYSYDEVKNQSPVPISTQKIFEYEPVMEGTPEENYIGVQANFWSHIDRSEYNIDKQLFPRLLGLAETAWSLPNKKDWEHFKEITRKDIDRLKTIDDVNVYNDLSL